MTGEDEDDAVMMRSLAIPHPSDPAIDRLVEIGLMDSFSAQALRLMARVTPPMLETRTKGSEYEYCLTALGKKTLASIMPLLNLPSNSTKQ